MFCKVCHVHFPGGRSKLMIGPEQTAMSVSHHDGPLKFYSAIRSALSVTSEQTQANIL